VYLLANKTNYAVCIALLPDAVVEEPAPIIRKVRIFAAQGGLLRADRSQVGAVATSTLFLKQNF
jgi:hypothetical protein